MVRFKYLFKYQNVALKTKKSMLKLRDFHYSTSDIHFQISVHAC